MLLQVIASISKLGDVSFLSASNEPAQLSPHRAPPHISRETPVEEPPNQRQRPSDHHQPGGRTEQEQPIPVGGREDVRPLQDDRPLQTQHQRPFNQTPQHDSQAGNHNWSAPSDGREDTRLRDENYRKDGPRKMLKILSFMDSNSKFLKDLWRNNTVIPCGTTYDLRKLLQSTNLSDVDLIVIHTGVNDIDTEDGDKVSQNLIDIVRRIQQNLPNVKVVVSEVTPRQLHRDEEVIRCNAALHAALNGTEGVTIAKHSNLRNDRWSFHIKGDDKHFSEISIARLASNLKNTFREAIGHRSSPRKRISDKKKTHSEGGGRKTYSQGEQNNVSEDMSFKQKLLQFLQNCWTGLNSK